MNVFDLAEGISYTLPETKICSKCKLEKPLSSFRTDKRGTRNVCIQCRSFQSSIVHKGRKKWLEEGKKIPEKCDCCGKTQSSKPIKKNVNQWGNEKYNYSNRMVYDHDHKTLKHRGWLCQQCNQGIGLLGDNLAGLKNAVRYLEESELK
jgi:hypothetical protein